MTSRATAIVRSAAAVATSAALAAALSACGTATSTGASSPTAATSSSPSASAESPSTSPSPASSASRSPESSQPACLTVAPRPFERSTPLPEGPLSRALQLRDVALACDAPALASIASIDQTQLSYGLVSPAEAFAIPQPEGDNRYDAIVTLLSLPAAEETLGGQTTYIWPRVHTQAGSTDDSAWEEVVTAGLLTAEQTAQMRAEGSGYLSYRLGIGASGQWMYLVGGD